MSSLYKKHRKIVLTVSILLLLAAIAWAAAELSGQANAMAMDAGSNSAEMESASLETLKKPKNEKAAPNCDWAMERDLRKKIEANDAQYQQTVKKAKAEISSQGKVSDATRSSVTKLASEYTSMQTQYADMWTSCGAKSRAKLAKSLGNARMKSAEVVVSEIDQKKLEEMNKANDEMKAARSEYVAEATANGELSQEDKREIQAKTLPRVDAMIPMFSGLVSNVMGLMKEVQKTAQQVTSAGAGGLGGLLGAAKAVSDGPQLLTKVQSLLTVSQGMLSNVQALQGDAQALTK